MPDDGLSEGIVTRAELARLANLFDQFEFAFDPLSMIAKEAEAEFENRVRAIFEERVSPHHPHLSFELFRCRVQSACRRFLRKNSPS